MSGDGVLVFLARSTLTYFDVVEQSARPRKSIGGKRVPTTPLHSNIHHEDISTTDFLQ